MVTIIIKFRLKLSLKPKFNSVTIKTEHQNLDLTYELSCNRRACHNKRGNLFSWRVTCDKRRAYDNKHPHQCQERFESSQSLSHHRWIIWSNNHQLFNNEKPWPNWNDDHCIWHDHRFQFWISQPIDSCDHWFLMTSRGDKVGSSGLDLLKEALNKVIESYQWT